MTRKIIQPDKITETERAALATRYTFFNGLSIEFRDKDKWAICDGGLVLANDNEWEYEPLPSSRSDEFKARTRYTLDEAFNRAEAYIGPVTLERCRKEGKLGL